MIGRGGTRVVFGLGHLEYASYASSACRATSYLSILCIDGALCECLCLLTCISSAPASLLHEAYL
jgi:hypothetical protein